MECYTSFNIECKTNSDAKQVARSIKDYLDNRGLSDHNLVKKISVLDSTVIQNKDFCTDDFWGDIFEEMCEYADSQYPGLIIRGESTYEESTGMHSQVSFERSDNGIDFSERFDDYDAIVFMIEEGMDADEIAKNTGLSLEEVQEYIRNYEEWDEAEEEWEDEE